MIDSIKLLLKLISYPQQSHVAKYKLKIWKINLLDLVRSMQLLEHLLKLALILIKMMGQN